MLVLATIRYLYGDAQIYAQLFFFSFKVENRFFAHINIYEVFHVLQFQPVDIKLSV